VGKRKEITITRWIASRRTGKRRGMRASGDLTVSVMGHHSAVICDQNRPVTRQTDVGRQDVDVVIGLAASHQRVKLWLCGCANFIRRSQTWWGRRGRRSCRGEH
jgi:hypothetical protein